MACERDKVIFAIQDHYPPGGVVIVGLDNTGILTIGAHLAGPPAVPGSRRTSFLGVELAIHPSDLRGETSRPFGGRVLCHKALPGLNRLPGS